MFQISIPDAHMNTKPSRFLPPVPSLTSGKGRCLTKNFGLVGVVASLGFQRIEFFIAKGHREFLKGIRTYFYQKKSEFKKSC
jgi:hypothetical protein